MTACRWVPHGLTAARPAYWPEGFCFETRKFAPGVSVRQAGITRTRAAATHIAHCLLKGEAAPRLPFAGCGNEMHNRRPKSLSSTSLLQGCDSVGGGLLTAAWLAAAASWQQLCTLMAAPAPHVRAASVARVAFRANTAVAAPPHCVAACHVS